MVDYDNIILVVVMFATIFMLIRMEMLVKKVGVVVNELGDLQDNTIFPQLTQYELEKLSIESEFDGRINRLKDELGRQKKIDEEVYTTAEELDPHVHNLPHSIIDEYDSYLPDVEISR